MYKPVQPIRCPKCGTTVNVNTSMILTSNPPCYEWTCPNCGEKAIRNKAISSPLKIKLDTQLRDISEKLTNLTLVLVLQLRTQQATATIQSTQCRQYIHQ